MGKDVIPKDAKAIMARLAAMPHKLHKQESKKAHGKKSPKGPRKGR